MSKPALQEFNDDESPQKKAEHRLASYLRQRAAKTYVNVGTDTNAPRSIYTPNTPSTATTEQIQRTQSQLSALLRGERDKYLRLADRMDERIFSPSSAKAT